MLTYSVFDALADPTRRAILRLLTGSDMSVNRLSAHFEVSRPAVSRHLRVLRRAGLVSVHPSGRERIYRLEPVVLQDAADWLFDVASRRILARETALEEAAEVAAEHRRESGERTTDWKQW